MQKIFLIVVFIFFSGAAEVSAQSRTALFEIDNQSREIKRRAIVATNLKLSAEEEDEFWKKYDTYRTQVKELEKQRFGLIEELAENITRMSEREADSLVTRALKLETSVKKMKQRHMLGLKRALGDAHLFKYYQIETKMDAIFEHGLTKSIPLVLTDEDKFKELERVSE